MKDKMMTKLVDVYARYQDLSQKMSDPDVIADTATWTQIAKDQAEIAETAQKYEEFLSVQKQMTDAEELYEIETDAEMRELLN